MPEIAIFMTDRDEIEFVQIVLSKGCGLVPSIHWDLHQYKEIYSVEKFTKMRQATNLYHIVSKEYEESPLVMRALEDGDPNSKYYIVQRSGGPTIDWFCPKPFKEGNVKFLPSGQLGYYNTYWSVRLKKSIVSPNTLKKVYRYFVNRLKSGGVIREYKGKKYIVCKNALIAENEGIHLSFR